MIRSIVIDDEQKHRDTIKTLIASHCPGVEIIAEAQDRDSIITLLASHRPDLVFMDIDLGGFTAFDILNELKEYYNFKIIFITESESYAVDSYRYNAIDYLLKPLKAQKLIEAVDKMIAHHNETVSKEFLLTEFQQLYHKTIAAKKITVSDAKGVHILKIHDIIYCQSNGNYTTFKMLDQSEIIISKNLKHFETKLESYNFLRIHKSYLVNIDHIHQILRDNEGSVLMINETILPLSKMHKKELLERLDTL